MSRQTEIQELLHIINRRLQLLKLQAAQFGSSTDPSILIEIEDIEQEILRLESELQRENLFSGTEPSLSVQLTHVTILLDRNIREFTSAERDNFIVTLSKQFIQK